MDDDGNSDDESRTTAVEVATKDISDDDNVSRDSRDDGSRDNSESQSESSYEDDSKSPYPMYHNPSNPAPVFTPPVSVCTSAVEMYAVF